MTSLPQYIGHVVEMPMLIGTEAKEKEISVLQAS